ATAGCFTKTARMRPDRRHAACTSTHTKSSRDNYGYRAANCPRCLSHSKALPEKESHMLSNIALWIDDRLHLSKLFVSTAGHTVPASAGSWFYVFGSGTLLCFLIQIVTGICLAFVYVP